jgi:hypothetical protein
MSTSLEIDSGYVAPVARSIQRLRPARIRQWQTLAADPLAQRPARHELHCDEVLMANGLDLVNDDDVRVIEAGSRSRLPDEARPAGRVSRM